MKRIAKAAAVFTGSFVLFMGGYVLGHPSPTAPAPTTARTVVQTTDDVTSFNDGYAEAMNEAEKNGPAYVHEWNAKIKAGTVGK